MNKYFIYIILLIIFVFVIGMCYLSYNKNNFFLYNEKPTYLQNYGLTRSKNINELYLTIDMCPSSKKSMEELLFLELIKLSKHRQTPINIAIAISGKWAETHENDSKKLLNWQKDGYLNITWVNHSYKHYYNPDLPIEKNFMIHDIGNAKNDIIKNQQVLLNYGVILSDFFRFPGLVSNRYLNNLVEKELHLRILGANAWLVKTSGKFSGGDIILIHGNKNEPKGIEIFLKLLKQGSFDKYYFAPITNL